MAFSAHPAKVRTHVPTSSTTMAHSASLRVLRFSAMRVMRSRRRFLSEDMVVAASSGFPGIRRMGIRLSSVLP